MGNPEVSKDGVPVVHSGTVELEIYQSGVERPRLERRALLLTLTREALIRLWVPRTP